MAGEPGNETRDASPGDGERARRIVRVTVAGAAVNAALAAAKLAAGVFGRSSALVADAAHSLSDLATDAAVLLFVRVSSRPPDEDHDFGHGKFETFATFLISLALFGVAFGLLRDAGVRALDAWRDPAAARPPVSCRSSGRGRMPRRDDRGGRSRRPGRTRVVPWPAPLPRRRR